MGNSQSSALEDAAKHDDIAKVRAFVSQNKLQMNGRDKDGWTPLHFASYWGSHRVMKELLELGADTELEDFRKRTPLHLAALQGDASAVSGLCTYKAKVNSKKEQGMTPLHKAAAQGHNEAAEELLAHNAEPNARDQDGNTPAHLAAKRGHAATIKLLFIRGADCRLANHLGVTPLHEAAASGHKAAAEALLSIGASNDAVDQRGQTPADLAQKEGHRDLLKLLHTPGTYQHSLDQGLPQKATDEGSASDVKYPALYKPAQAKAAASAAQPAAAAAAAAGASDVQYPGLYQPNKPLKEQTTGVEKEFWTKKTNPTFPSAPTPAPTPTTSSIPDHAEPSPRPNPFLDKGKPASGAGPEAFPGKQHEQRQTGDQSKKDPRKEFEAGLLGAAQGVFQFFNKPNQKGQKPGQAGTAKQAEQQRADANINEDWGNQQAREGEFKVPHQKQTSLEPYSTAEDKEDVVQYPTIGKPAHTQAQTEAADESRPRYPTIRPNRPKHNKAANKDDVAQQLDDLELEVQGGARRR